MPTAILLSHMPEGFFVAADGRSLRDDGTVFSDTEQKIFPFEDERGCFAFAITGMVRFTPDDTEDANDIVFDFNATVPKVASSLRTSVHRDGIEYSDRLASSVRESLKRSVEDARRAGRNVSYPSNQDQFGDGMIAWLFLCGYYSRVPYQVTFRFSHHNQHLAPAETIDRLALGRSIVSGSEKVSKLLYESSDQRFARFRKNNPTFVQSAENYVAACSSEDGLGVDREICRKIGGYVHAAEITPSGFRWLKPPFQSNAPAKIPLAKPSN